MASPALSLIQQTTLASSASSITFSAIPTTFKSLLFKLSIRTDRSATKDNLSIRANGLSTSIYLLPFIQSTGTSTPTGVSTYITSNTSWTIANAINGNASTANYFSYGEILFSDYQIANAKSGIASFSANNNTAGGNHLIQCGLGFNSTAAITSLEFYPATGPNFLANSRIALYGVNNT
jgi:hypothetical protein